MSSRKKLTPEKIVDFLSAALADENPCKATLVRLAGSKGSPPPPPPPTPSPAAADDDADAADAEAPSEELVPPTAVGTA